MLHTVYVGLGSNLADPKMQITNALAALSTIKDTRVTAVSSIYLSKPLGPQDQPDFVNAVCQLATNLSAEHLLDSLQAIESEFGRVRKEERWGARVLDLDILLFDHDIINSPRLTIPHYDMTNREFVMTPLAEISHDLNLPSGESVRQIAEKLPQNDMQKLELRFKLEA